MGFTEATMTVRNPRGGPSGEVSLLVDSGALYSSLPSGLLEELGIKRDGGRRFKMANGQIIRRKLGQASFGYKGREMTSPVIFGEEEDVPVLGVVTLESLGLELDPLRKRLRPARLLLV